MDEIVFKILTALNKQARETLKVANELYEKGSEFLVSLLSALVGLVLILILLLYLNTSIPVIAIFSFIGFFIFFLVGIIIFRTFLTSRFTQERKITAIDGETEIIQAELKNLRERNKLREANETALVKRLGNVKDVIVEMQEIKQLANQIGEEKVANQMLEQIYDDFKNEDEKADILLLKNKKSGANKNLPELLEDAKLLKEKE